MRLHYANGSLLEYNGVYLAEGPWPGKAYFDALRRARQRDASTFIDYGFTRPSVISRGPIPQVTGTPNGAQRPAPMPTEAIHPVPPVENQGPAAGATPPEPIPSPTGHPLSLSSFGPVNMVEFVQPLPAVGDHANPAGAAPVTQALATAPAMPAGPSASVQFVPVASAPPMGHAAAAPSSGTAMAATTMTPSGQLPTAASATVPSMPANPFLTNPAATSAANESQADHAAAQVAPGATGR
jgi:hypothetical protein